MCLNIKATQRRDNEGFAIPSIARRDITCYKWLERDNKELHSPIYRKTPIKIGQKMKVSKLDISNHSVYEGIHAFYNKRRALHNNSFDDVIVECIIPKGAQYIKGHNYHIVATEMKLKRIIAEGGKLKKPRNGSKN